ncbi:MAG: ankyrin repeat domain-containing protein [Bacteroidota bacterium]
MSGGDWKEMLVAVQEGNIALVKYYLSEGIDPNYEHPELMTTALIECVNFDRYDIAELLLKNGANPTQNAWMSTDNPLRVAKSQRKKEMVKLLKSYLPKRSFLQKFCRSGH